MHGDWRLLICMSQTVDGESKASAVDIIRVLIWWHCPIQVKHQPWKLYEWLFDGIALYNSYCPVRRADGIVFMMCLWYCPVRCADGIVLYNVPMILSCAMCRQCCSVRCAYETVLYDVPLVLFCMMFCMYCGSAISALPGMPLSREQHSRKPF